MAKIELNVTKLAGTSKRQRIDINSEENIVKYCLISSLQHVAITKIIIIIWKRIDLKSHIVKLLNEYEDYTNSISDMEYILFPEIKAKMLEKLSEIAIPNRIRKILSNIVDPMLNEIIEWIGYQNRFIFYDSGDQEVEPTATNYIDALVWTSSGVIDYKETAKTLLAKDTLSDDYKYNIACAYCLEYDIEMIAPKVINTTLNLKSFEKQTMLLFWTAHIKGEFTELDEAVNDYNIKKRTHYSRNECIFKVLIDTCNNPVAIKYLWYQLSNEEKLRCLVPAILSCYGVDIKCFFLSQINKKQEHKLFQTYLVKHVLLSFFDHWLWGHYFLPLMHHAWYVMSGEVYLEILEYIMDEIVRNDEDTEKCNRFKATLEELWQYAPQHLKEYVLENDDEIDEEVLSLLQF